MSTTSPRYAIVLAGGASTRMGRDKAFLEVAGETLAARTTRVVGEVCDVVIVVGAPGRPLPELAPSVVLAFDDVRGGGPLAGVAAGLAALPMEAKGHALVVGVDMPLLGAELLRALLAVAPAGRATAVARDRGILPLPAWIPLPAARDAVTEGLRLGDRSLQGLLRRLDVHVVARDSLLAASASLAAADPELLGLEDADDPAALAALLAR